MVVKECWGWIDGLSSEEVLFTLHLIPVRKGEFAASNIPHALGATAKRV